MINSINTDIDFYAPDNSTFYEFYLESNNSIIGRYNISVNNEEISLSFFEILKNQRNKGFGKDSLKIIYENIKEISKEHNLFNLEICAKPLDNSISLSNLVNLYKKYLFVDVDYDNNTSIILRGKIIYN